VTSDAEKGRTAATLAQALAELLCEPEMMGELIAIAEEREDSSSGHAAPARAEAPHEDM
jgi:hypothetical protein